MRISDWSSDVCPSDLGDAGQGDQVHRALQGAGLACSASAEPGEEAGQDRTGGATPVPPVRAVRIPRAPALRRRRGQLQGRAQGLWQPADLCRAGFPGAAQGTLVRRSEEHTSELQSLMRISYAVFCLKKKTKKNREE